MPQPRDFDVSVVLPFGDDEEVIGNACRRLASHLRGLGLAFEILAVDQDSTDNCHAVLALLRSQVPEVRVLLGSERRRAFAAGALQARGRTLWLIDAATAATTPLAPFGRAQQRVGAREVDAVVVDHRFAVCHRTRGLGAVAAARGTGDRFLHRLVRRAEARRLAVEVQGPARRPERFGRLLALLATARLAR